MPTDNDKHLLAKLVGSHREFIESIDRTISTADDIVELVTSGLQGNVPTQMAAIEMTRRCPVEVRKKLLPALLRCSRSINAPVVSVILTLPQKWLVEQIEEVLDPLLDGADHIDYDFFLQLFDRIDLALAKRLAQHTLSNSDPDVREMASEYLAKRDERLSQTR
jgi:hypothetical protein